jgi:hypothetical protein
MGEPCSWLPDEVILNGLPFRVIQKDKGKIGSGFVDYDKKIVSIGVKGWKGEEFQLFEIKNTFVHENLEGILMIKGYKYVSREGFVYIVDHRQYTDVADNLTYALKDVLK